MMWSAGLLRGTTLNSVKEQHPICTWMNGIAPTPVPQGTIQFLPKMFWAKPFPRGLGTGPGNKKHEALIALFKYSMFHT